MKKVKLKILSIIILLFIASFTPSCDALLQAMNDNSSQVDNKQDNNTKKKTNDADSNGKTSLGKKSGGGIYNFIQ